MRATAICLFILFFAFFTASSLIANEENPKAAFIDLDGDGFDDNASDADNNSIPDQAEENHDSFDDSDSENAFSGFAPIEPVTRFDLNSLLSNSERFGKLKAAVNTIVSCRGGFEAGENFGPGNGIGSGAVSGGCPGGVCH